MVAFHGALGHRDLLHRNDRFARPPVQHIEVATLGGLDDGRDLALRPVDVHQGGLGRQVAIPEVMVHGLELPAHLAGVQVKRHQGIGETLGFGGARHAPLVRRLIAGGNVDQPQRLVGRGDGPGVRRAAHIGVAGRQRLGSLRIAGVEVPHQKPAAYVIGTDHPTGGIHRAVIGDRASDDHQFLGDDGRRSGQVDAQRALAETCFQIDHSRLAEVFARLAVLDVQRNQGAVIGRQKQPALATRHRCIRLRETSRGSAVGSGVVKGQATAGHVLVVLGIRIDGGIETPALLAGIGIQRDGNAVRGADEQFVAHLERRDLIGQLAGIALARQIAGVILPGLLQAANILRRDQVGRRIAIAAAGAAVRRPFAGQAPGLAFRVESFHLCIAERALERVVVLRQRVAGHQRPGDQP